MHGAKTAKDESYMHLRGVAGNFHDKLKLIKYRDNSVGTQVGFNVFNYIFKRFFH